VSAGDLIVSARPAGFRFGVRVQPRAVRDGVTGIRDGRLVVRVTAPPVDSSANDAALRLLAHLLGIPPSRVRLVSGRKSRNKTVEVSGISEVALRRLID
jgi:uncharacterized protein (TIGR00251 family)